MTIVMEARSDIISEQKVGRAFFVKKISQAYTPALQTTVQSWLDEGNW